VSLLEACARRRINVVLCGSSAVYGGASGAIDEGVQPAPVSLYGLAKAFQEQLTRAFSADELSVCIARLFNLIGPGQAPGMLVPDWLAGLAAIAAGGEPVLRVRNRATCRDFIDVRDAATALQCMVVDFRPGLVANIASGESVSLMQLSHFLETLCPVPFRIVETQPSPHAQDIPQQSGDAALARQTWGWTPTVDWRQSVRDAWLEFDENDSPKDR
jgi:GDP-4-dehydro-6-deoxy-D-mannose reductase